MNEVSSIQVTVEMEDNGKLPFMDVLVCKTHVLADAHLQKTYIYRPVSTLSV